MGDDRLESARAALRRRLADELGDEESASEVVASLDHAMIDRLVERAAGDIATADVLSYRPARIADHEIRSLWVLAFGYRFADGRQPTAVGETPPMSDLEPGPVNEALARAAASFVLAHPLPIIAQWEVAHVLDHLGIPDVVSVEPDHTDDGSVVYLSTAGVIEKGLRLAADAGIAVGSAGVIGHADHAQRCLLTAAATGLRAAVPEGVDLPTDYDPRSGQPWTRSRTDFIAVDLMARSFMA
jgi:hypothetical protein